MSGKTTTDTGTLTLCANCGKGEENSSDLKACTACKLVKYCNRDCQIAHRPQHKKVCKKRAKEIAEEERLLRQHAKDAITDGSKKSNDSVTIISDDELFKDPPPREECPICTITLPLKDDSGQTSFQPCCGKIICDGCIIAMALKDRQLRKKDDDTDLCAFCRTRAAFSGSEIMKRLMKLMKNGNARAYNMLACLYADGVMGLPKDAAKAHELYLKAAELGCATSYHRLAHIYEVGGGCVEVDKKKAKRYWELAAIKGNVFARHNLGALEVEAGNVHRAMKHFIIAASAGEVESLNGVKQGFLNGYVTKDEYASTLRAYQKSTDEMKSEPRDEAERFRKLASEEIRNPGSILGDQLRHNIGDR